MLERIFSAKRTAKDKTPVVYTMGKVGSTALSKAIARAGLPCHDIHYLESEYVLQRAAAATADERFPEPHICMSMAWRDRLYTKPDACLYVTAVRDPIARNLSAFFQNITEAKLKSNSPQTLLQEFQHSYPHTIPLTWLDREFHQFTGFNVYEHKFEPARLYETYSNNIIIFRTDCPDTVKEKVLSKSLGTKIQLRKENVGSVKAYAPVYEAVLDAAKFPESFVEPMYDNRFARHFWHEDEIDVMKSRWTL